VALVKQLDKASNFVLRKVNDVFFFETKVVDEKVNHQFRLPGDRLRDHFWGSNSLEKFGSIMGFVGIAFFSQV
jgi:hypothetical protein